MDFAVLAAEFPDAMPGLLRYARTLTRDPEAAEDLVQETLERALERASGFRGDASTTTWLHRILHNLAIDQLRGRREEPGGDLVADAVEAQWRDDSYTVDPEAVVVRAEQRSDLLEALTHLPFMYRSAVVLHDASGLTVPEVADEELDPATSRRVEKHLEDCPTCPPLYAALVGVAHVLQDSSRDPDSVVPPEVADRLTRVVTPRAVTEED